MKWRGRKCLRVRGLRVLVAMRTCTSKVPRHLTCTHAAPNQVHTPMHALTPLRTSMSVPAGQGPVGQASPRKRVGAAVSGGASACQGNEVCLLMVGRSVDRQRRLALLCEWDQTTTSLRLLLEATQCAHAVATSSRVCLVLACAWVHGCACVSVCVCVCATRARLCVRTRVCAAVCVLVSASVVVFVGVSCGCVSVCVSIADERNSCVACADVRQIPALSEQAQPRRQKRQGGGLGAQQLMPAPLSAIAASLVQSLASSCFAAWTPRQRW
jgi:hypothetical protein